MDIWTEEKLFSEDDVNDDKTRLNSIDQSNR